MWHTWRFLKIRNKNHRTAKRTWGRSRQSGRRLPKPRSGHSGVGDTIRGQRRPRALCPTYGLFSGDPVAGWLSVSAPEGRDKRPLVASLWPETAPGRSRVGCSETDELPGGPAVLGPGRHQSRYGTSCPDPRFTSPRAGSQPSHLVLGLGVTCGRVGGCVVSSWRGVTGSGSRPGLARPPRGDTEPGCRGQATACPGPPAPWRGRGPGPGASPPGAWGQVLCSPRPLLPPPPAR